jgi:uncharacterized protein (TIGR00255 family)
VIKSMTGYGAAEGALGDGRLAIEVRTVNHRHLNTQFRLPHALQRFEAELRNRLRDRLERGHTAVSARWTEEPPRGGSIALNLERARALIDAVNRLKQGVDVPGEIDLAFVARQPEVLVSGEEEDPAIELAALLALLDRAVDDVIASRTQEGQALARELEQRLDNIETQLGVVEARAPLRLTRERDRLREAVRELLDGRTVDEDRLSQELALIADKLDVTEEVVRLRAHLAACRQALASEGAAGRQLAFLGQEMLREINTIGSKANDADMAHTVIAMKGELEKIREQAENVE